MMDADVEDLRAQLEEQRAALARLQLEEHRQREEAKRLRQKLRGLRPAGLAADARAAQCHEELLRVGSSAAVSSSPGPAEPLLETPLRGSAVTSASPQPLESLLEPSPAPASPEEVDLSSLEDEAAELISKLQELGIEESSTAAAVRNKKGAAPTVREARLACDTALLRMHALDLNKQVVILEQERQRQEDKEMAERRGEMRRLMQLDTMAHRMHEEVRQRDPLLEKSLGIENAATSLLEKPLEMSPSIDKNNTPTSLLEKPLEVSPGISNVAGIHRSPSSDGKSTKCSEKSYADRVAAIDRFQRGIQNIQRQPGNREGTPAY